MARYIITLDGQTLMDNTVDIRRGELPTLDELKKTLGDKAGGNFQPWSVLSLQALALELQPLLTGTQTSGATIAVTTRDDGYTINITR